MLNVILFDETNIFTMFTVTDTSNVTKKLLYQYNIGSNLLALNELSISPR